MRENISIQTSYVFFSGANTIGGDAIATKVVELSKKNRELSAELESERAKLKKLSIKCKELESLVEFDLMKSILDFFIKM